MKFQMLHIHSLLALALLGLAGCGPSSEESTPASTEVAVEVGQVIRTTLRAYLDTYGAVEPEPAAGGRPAGAAYLTTPVAGLVRTVPVAEGQAVRAGDLVIRLDDRMAQAEADRARARALFAQQTLEREQTLLAQHNTSQKRFEEAQQALALARADLATAEGMLAQVQLRSPLDGVVSRVHVLPGQSVDLNTVVAEVVDLRRLVVTARLPAGEAVRVKAGQAADVSTGEDGAPVIPATVSFVGPSVDPKTGTVLVRLTVPADSGLRPGGFVRVRIVVEEHPERLAVPRESVYTDGDGRSTLSVVTGDSARQSVVRVGLQDGDLIEVEGPDLFEGATVVTVGSYALPEKTKVRRLSAEAGDQE